MWCFLVFNRFTFHNVYNILNTLSIIYLFLTHCTCSSYVTHRISFWSIKSHEYDKTYKDCECQEQNKVEDRPSYWIVLSYLSTIDQVITEYLGVNFCCYQQPISMFQWANKRKVTLIYCCWSNLFKNNVFCSLVKVK